MADSQFLTITHLATKDIARIFSKIQIDRVTGCWNWTGALNTYGYGQVWYQGRDALTHRLLFAWLVGQLPKGHGAAIPQLDHVVCNNRRCGNPAHLILTSAKANVLRAEDSVSGFFSRQTHCKRGHLLPTERNRSDGKGRRCLTCCAERGHARYLANRPAETKPKPVFATQDERAAHRRIKAQEWRDANRERLRAYFRNYVRQKPDAHH